jgi:hypothetical protein
LEEKVWIKGIEIAFELERRFAMEVLMAYNSSRMILEDRKRFLGGLTSQNTGRKCRTWKISLYPKFKILVNTFPHFPPLFPSIARPHQSFIHNPRTTNYN